jgi:hypothetical protein
MQKELHIWMGENYPNKDNLCISLEHTERFLQAGWEIVHTTQPHVCNTTWLLKGYRIFVHMLDGETVEIKFGEIKGREIRVCHNLEKMLLANCFGKATLE